MSDARIISPTLHTAAIAGLEQVINTALAWDPASQQRLAKLDGHVFHWQCTQPLLDLYLIPGDDGIMLCGQYHAPADTVLKGSANEFFKLATADDPASALINGELELHGSSNALIELQKIGAQLDIDWETPIVQLFGDVVGHQISEGLRQASQFGLQLFKSLQRQTEDYLTQESELLVPDWQVENFLAEVDQLSLRTERLEAKLNRLKQRAAAQRPQD